MAEVRVLSMNVRGFATDIKRRDTFKWLREQKGSIYCLQDIHCKVQQVRYWINEWGYKGIIAPYKGDSRGVAILFDNNFEFKIHDKQIDPGGNYIILDLEFGNRRITIVNIYGPNRDNPEFYTEIQNSMEKYENNSVIMCGDWNLVLDYILDTCGYLCGGICPPL